MYATFDYFNNDREKLLLFAKAYSVLGLVKQRLLSTESISTLIIVVKRETNTYIILVRVAAERVTGLLRDRLLALTTASDSFKCTSKKIQTSG